MIEILDFYADWCQPCLRLAPILEEIEGTFDWVSIKRIDVEEDVDMTAKYAVQNIPTLLFFKDGVLVDKVVGMTSKSNLLDVINKYS